MSLSDIPFVPLRGRLYTVEELAGAFDPARPDSFAETADFAVYRHFVRSGGATPRDSLVSMLQALHDNSISQALVPFLAGQPRVAAVMGGHRLHAAAPAYRTVAHLAQRLAREGFLLASGGGPGAMEATHLGALLRGAEAAELDRAIAALAARPEMPDAKGIVAADGAVDAGKLAALAAWWAPAAVLRRAVRDPGVSLAVPTWHYGHEPFTPFATHVAKYFQNSIREDGLLALAGAGVVFAEGKAGTLQEVFQDAAQNYYRSFGDRFSPMVFLGTRTWTADLPVMPLLRALFEANGRGGEFADNVLLTDSIEAAAEFLLCRSDAATERGLLDHVGLGQTASPCAEAGRIAPSPAPPPLSAVPRPDPAGRRFRIASFNVENLSLPDLAFAGRTDPPLDRATYEDKVAWIGRVLDDARADLVGFQELFAWDALAEAVGRSAHLSRGVTLLAPEIAGGANLRTAEGRTEASGPHVGLATRLEVLGHESVALFPAAADLRIPLGAEGAKTGPVRLPIARFERPVLRARVRLPGGPVATVFVAHLKSKRPKFLDDEDPADPVVQALGQMRSLVVRAAEAAALRALAVAELRGQDRPVIVLGDMNDDAGAVTTRMLGGEAPRASAPDEVKARLRDVLLHSVHDLVEGGGRGVAYTHLFQGQPELLDHILVSQELVRANPQRLGEVRRTRILNDHLSDDRADPFVPGSGLPDRRRSRSDHGVTVATVEMRG